MNSSGVANADAITNQIDFNFIWNTGYDNGMTIAIGASGSEVSKTVTAYSGSGGTSYTQGVMTLRANSGANAATGNSYKLTKSSTGNSILLGFEAYDSNNAEISLINCSYGSQRLYPITGGGIYTVPGSGGVGGYLYPPTPASWYQGINMLIGGQASPTVGDNRVNPAYGGLYGYGGGSGTYPSPITPDAVVIGYGINHWGDANVSVSFFQSALDATVAAFLNTANTVGNVKIPVIFMLPPPSPTGTASVAKQQSIINAYYAVAVKYGIAVIDAWNYFGGTNAKASVPVWMNSGNVHPYPAGYAVESQLFTNFIKSIL